MLLTELKQLLDKRKLLEAVVPFCIVVGSYEKSNYEFISGISVDTKI